MRKLRKVTIRIVHSNGSLVDEQEINTDVMFVPGMSIRTKFALNQEAHVDKVTYDPLENALIVEAKTGYLGYSVVE